jgi:hypothetical protein
MKKYLSFSGLVSLILYSEFIVGQPPANPPSPYQNGNGSSVKGETVHNTPAPVDGGLGILMLLSLGYGAGKILRIRKKEEN